MLGLDLLITTACFALVALSLYPRSVKAQVWARTLTFLGRPFASLVILIGGLSPSASDDEVAAAAADIAKTARGDKSSLSLLESAPEDVLSTILTYATAADLLATGAAAPSFVKACLCDAAPWTALRRRLPLGHASAKPPRSNERQRFFEAALSAGAAFAATDDRVCIGLGGRAIDATAWLSQHPGGAAVLEHYRGRDATAALIAFPHSASARRHMRQLVVYAPDAIVGRPGAPYLAVARLRGKRNAAARRRTAARLEKLRLMQLGVFCFPRRRSAAPTSF